jgi:AraC-like DNA-binding protein
LNELAVDRPEIWHDETLPGVVWMRGAASEYRIDPVDEYVIGVPTFGGYELHRRNRTRVVRPGELVLLDPSHSHRGTPTEKAQWRARLVVLPAALLWSTLDDRPELLRTTIDEPVVDRPELRERFLALHRASQAGVSRLELECRMLSLLDDLVPAAGGARRPSGDPTVTVAIRHLRDTFLETIDLDTLPASAGTTKFRLLSRFRAELGVTPHQFLVSVRVAHARRLLAVGTPVSEAAAVCGFADQSHLTRHFRNRLDITPGRYRQATQAPH